LNEDLSKLSAALCDFHGVGARAVAHWEAATGLGVVVVTHDGFSSTPFVVTLRGHSPALTGYDGSGTGMGIFLSGARMITAQNPANGGDTLSTLAVGLGATNPAIATGEVTPPPPPSYVTLVTPALLVAGTNAKVTFSGLAPGAIGQDQVNFNVPASTPAGSQNLNLKIGAATSNTVTLPIGFRQVNSQVSIAKGQLKYHQAQHIYTQAVRIQNTSGTALPAAGTAELVSLTLSSQLVNGGGATCPSSDGSPYASFTFAGTGSAQTATLLLAFTDSGAVNESPRAVAAVSTRPASIVARLLYFWFMTSPVARHHHHAATHARRAVS